MRRTPALPGVCATRNSMATTAFDVDAARARFSALARPLAFFDGPGGTQCPDEVIDAIAAYLREANANVGAPYDTSRRTDELVELAQDRKSTRLNSSHSQISYAVFCL